MMTRPLLVLLGTGLLVASLAGAAAGETSTVAWHALVGGGLLVLLGLLGYHQLAPIVGGYLVLTMAALGPYDVSGLGPVHLGVGFLAVVGGITGIPERHTGSR